MWLAQPRDGQVKSFYPDFDPNQYNEYAFSGIHVLSPKIFDWMEEWTGKFSIINFYLSISPRPTSTPTLTKTFI